MRILFFSSQAYDSESFQASNHRHGFELHFQQAHLQADTAVLAQGFEVVCAFVNDDLSRPVLERLAAGGCAWSPCARPATTTSTWPPPKRSACRWCTSRPIRRTLSPSTRSA